MILLIVINLLFLLFNMAKLSDLQQVLIDIADRFDKGIGEVIAEIDTLKNALQNVDVPPEVQASVDRLAVLAAKLDDLNPDQITDEPPTSTDTSV